MSMTLTQKRATSLWSTTHSSQLILRMTFLLSSWTLTGTGATAFIILQCMTCSASDGPVCHALWQSHGDIRQLCQA